jgi:iron-sulfur cluster repair protein YtfE (RIC family)
MPKRAVRIGLTAAGIAGALLYQRARREEARSTPADVRFMYAMHEAFRRDVGRLCSAVAAMGGNQPVPPKVREGWEQFRHQLEVHHQAEDEDLWPALRAQLTRAADLAEVDAMVREHAAIPAALESVARGLDGVGDLDAVTSGLAILVTDHLDHEERTVLPMIEQHLSDADWHAFLETERRKSPASERATFICWVLDDASPASEAAVWREIPAPGRLVFRRFFQPRYEARRLWSHDAQETRIDEMFATT